MMKLKEAIQHLQETIADPTHKWGCEECKAEHVQLLLWLEEYEKLKSDYNELLEDYEDLDKQLRKAKSMAYARWIPCSERMPDNADHKGAQCTKCMIITALGVTEGWYNPDYDVWFVLTWYTSSIFFRDNLDMKGGDEPNVEILEREWVSHWMPYPDPPKGGTK